MAPCSVLQYELMKLGQSTRDAMQWSSGLRGSPHLIGKINILGGNQGGSWCRPGLSICWALAAVTRAEPLAAERGRFNQVATRGGDAERTAQLLLAKPRQAALMSREALEEGDARLEDRNAELQNHCARRGDVRVERRRRWRRGGR